MKNQREIICQSYALKNTNFHNFGIVQWLNQSQKNHGRVVGVVGLYCCPKQMSNNPIKDCFLESVWISHKSVWSVPKKWFSLPRHWFPFVLLMFFFYPKALMYAQFVGKLSMSWNTLFLGFTQKIIAKHRSFNWKNHRNKNRSR